MSNMNHSPYEGWRDWLAQLADQPKMQTLVAQTGAEEGWWSDESIWQQEYGRFTPHDQPSATLLYETAEPPQKLCLIECFVEQPTITSHQTRRYHPDLGWLRFTRFPHDPTLPGLQTVLQMPGQAHVVRYRPHKRCTIRFTHPENGRIIFAKLFTDNRGAQIHTESIQLWEAAKANLLDFQVAPPIRWDEPTHTLWQGFVPGKPVLPTLKSKDGPQLAKRMGTAVASTTTSPLSPTITFTRQDQMKRTQKYIRKLSQHLPNLAPALNHLCHLLQSWHDTLPQRPLRPIHGAPHAHQWLQTPNQLGLVDFDRLAWGEPELDVATFITEIDFEDWSRFPGAAVNRHFIQGYETIAGPLDKQILALYCAHKRLAKALKAAYAIRPYGDLQAERHLGRALTLAASLDF